MWINSKNGTGQIWVDHENDIDNNIQCGYKKAKPQRNKKKNKVELKEVKKKEKEVEKKEIKNEEKPEKDFLGDIEYEKESLSSSFLANTMWFIVVPVAILASFFMGAWFLFAVWKFLFFSNILV